MTPAQSELVYIGLTTAFCLLGRGVVFAMQRMNMYHSPPWSCRSRAGFSLLL